MKTRIDEEFEERLKHWLNPNRDSMSVHQMASFIHFLITTVTHYKEERNVLSRKLNQQKSRREFLLEQEITRLRRGLGLKI